MTLLFGLVGLIAQTDGFELPRQSHGPLGFALGAFVLASLLALGTNAPLPYTGIDPDGINDLLDKRWADDEARARLRVASSHQKVFAQAQRMNEWKARLLQAAMAVEVLAVVGVALAVREVLRSA